MAKNLLPKSSTEFRSKVYWEQFFRDRDRSFEWYGDFRSMKDLLLADLREADRILVVGCGNSDLSAEVYDTGRRHIANVDFSDTVITRMSQLNQKRELMTWHMMDMCLMNFDNASFNKIIDKGGLDALFSEPSAQAQDMCRRYFSEVQRLLVDDDGSSYVCITLGQDYILAFLLQTFSSSYSMKFSCISPGNDAYLVLYIVITKQMSMELPMINFDCFSLSCSPYPINISELPVLIESSRSFREIRFRIQSLSRLEPVARFVIANPNINFTHSISILQRFSNDCNSPCSVVLVPSNKSSDWLYATDEGLSQLGDSAGSKRLICVTCPNDVGLDVIQPLIDPMIMFLASDLTINNDNDCSHRFGNSSGERIRYMMVMADSVHWTVVYSGESELSGAFTIEDEDEDAFAATTRRRRRRRLVMSVNNHIVQSESIMELDSADGSYRVIPLKLSFDYHKSIVGLIGLALPRQRQRQKVMVIGLGGGCLLNALSHLLATDDDDGVRLVAVDIDEQMRDVSVNWFGLKISNSVSVVIDDGLHVLSLHDDDDNYSAIVIDVDCKDTSLGMSCPPPSFVTPSSLCNIRNKVFPACGMIIINVAARSTNCLHQVIADCKVVVGERNVFVMRPCEQDVNCVVVCCVGAVAGLNDNDDDDDDDNSSRKHKKTQNNKKKKNDQDTLNHNRLRQISMNRLTMTRAVNENDQDLKECVSMLNFIKLSKLSL